MTVKVDIISYRKNKTFEEMVSSPDSVNEALYYSVAKRVYSSNGKEVARDFGFCSVFGYQLLDGDYLSPKHLQSHLINKIAEIETDYETEVQDLKDVLEKKITRLTDSFRAVCEEKSDKNKKILSDLREALAATNDYISTNS